MEEKFVTLAEVIHKMDNGERFDIEVVTADVNRGTGGDLKAYANCIIRRQTAKPISINTSPAPTQGLRSPNHFQNSTRNIYQLSDRRAIKVHLRLITRFNGTRVL